MINLSDSHLFYIIENRIANDKYSGLSHVAEHTLLIPTDIGKSFKAKGYTCINHVFLSFSSPELTILKEIDSQIMSGRVITGENVRIAKEQVMWEIANKNSKTTISMQIQSFVTDNRIANYAIGKTDQIKKMQTSDVADWFRQRGQSGQIHRYLFNSRDEIIEATQYMPRTFLYPESEIPKQDNGTIKTLFLVPSGQVKTVRMYFRIPSLTRKLDILKKGVMEYCIQKKLLSSLKIDVDIYDKFFDVDERYVLLEFAWNRNKELCEIIRLILSEIESISYEDFTLCRSEFVILLGQLLQYDKSTYLRINAIKNEIVYHCPYIKSDDLRMIEQINYDSFLRCKRMYEPIKTIFL